MISLNQAFPFWDQLSELQRADILDATIIRQYEAGETVEIRAGLFLVTDGNVILSNMNSSGRRVTAFSARWMETILLAPRFLEDVNVDSLELLVREDGELYFIPYESWWRFMEEYPDIREYSINLLSLQMSSLIFGIQTRMEKDISKRLALFLLRYYNQSKESTGNVILVSHEELAEETGTTREVVTRNISVLKEKGFIETGRGKIRIVSPDRLRVYADEFEEMTGDEED